jgi:hypothetical protein
VNAEPLEPSDAFAQAKRNPFPTFPAKWIGLGWDGQWAGIYGWMMVHVLVGDGRVGRVHMYSRMVDESPVSVTRKRARLSEEEAFGVHDLMLANDWIGRLRRQGQR